MGFRDGEINLDSSTGSYYAGQFVNGRLVFVLNSDHNVRGIYMLVKGFCQVHWTEQRSRRVNDRTEHYTVDHNSYEEYITLNIPLFGSKAGEHKLRPKQYDYPFNFQLPATCPSSFEASNGHVRYELRAIMSVPYNSDKELIKQLRVIAPLDLNTINCKNPINFEFEHSFCTWCCSSGIAETAVKVPVRGFCPGQVVPVEVSCNNRSSVDIDYIKLKIRKEIKFRAQHEPDTRSEQSSVLELSKGGVPATTDRAWVVDMRLPDMDVHNMEGCSFIDISYDFKVSIESSGCHTDDDDSCEIFIGTVPLLGFQNTLSAPDNTLQDQNQLNPAQNYPVPHPLYPPPIINQPVSNNQYQRSHSPFPPNPYPPSHTPSPHPSPNLQNAPYPVGNSPYPVGNSPYPGNNAPYPGNNAPYPANNAPFPAKEFPYPGNNAPYPGENAPYPGNNAPYPGDNASYPGNNAPYPGDNAPYPANNAPFPAKDSPYLGDNAPYPSTNSPYNANPPYPVTTSPYPVPQNAPYPNATSPFSGPQANTSPYPANPPYPVSNAPYPGVGSPGAGLGSPGMGGGSLKTGSLGFGAGGTRDSSTVPLLPPGSVPMPLPMDSHPRSPFAGASAPAPATPAPAPDDKNPMASEENSPFNPAFMGADEKKDNDTEK